MSGFSIDGLATGLDTTSIINQLMAVERQPLVRLQSRQATFNARVSAWGEIKSKLNALNTAIKDLRDADDFNLFTATSSDETRFTATAGKTAAPGAFSFSVEQLATSHQLISQGFAGSDALVGAGTATVSQGLASIGATAVAASSGGLPSGGYSIEVKSVDTGAGTAVVDFNGTEQTVSANAGTITLTSDDGSLDLTIGSQLAVGTADVAVVVTDAASTVADLRDALNQAGAGSSATVVNTGNGATPYKLIVSSRETGTDNALTVDVSGLSGFTAAFTELRAPLDAQIMIGTETITAQSNTLTDVLQGVTIDLHAAEPGTEVTLEVDHDQDALVEKVKAFVDAINGLLTAVDKHAKYDVDAKKGGVLVGDSRVRQVVARIQTALGYTDADLERTFLGSVGVSVTSEGRYELDEDELRDALADDLEGVFRLFTEDDDSGRAGVMGTLFDAVDPLREPGGLVDTATEGAQAQIDRITDQVADMEVRMAAVELRFRRQFTALETTLGQLKNQSSWLSAQLGGLY